VRERRARQTITFLSMLSGLIVIGLASYTSFTGLWLMPGQEPLGTRHVCPTPTPIAASVESVNVNVYNATTRRGLANQVTLGLQKLRMKVSDIGNKQVPTKKAVAAIVIYTPDRTLQAATVKATVNGAVTMQLNTDANVTGQLDLILGNGYQNLRSATEVAALTATPKVDMRLCTTIYPPK
jgi:hypothetical protein